MAGKKNTTKTTKKVPLNTPSSSLRFKIAVSGAAETALFKTDREHAEMMKKIYRIGYSIAKRGIVVVTGATTGAPYWAARGAKEAGGFVLGISPALTIEEHTKTYKLPTDYHDIIIFTGLGYAGRNLFVIRGADAIITVTGRTGTLNEFTDAFEDEKPQGVLSNSGGTTDLIPEILKRAKRGTGKIVFDEDPDALVEKVIAMLTSGK